MDSEVGKSVHLQDLPKLGEGERVEVRQKDKGLRGSWHPGTVVALKAGRRVVEYDELLTDDGISKLRETIPCAKLIEKPTPSPGICTPQKNTALVATPTRSPFKRRGLLRPSPPICTAPSPLTWKSGLYVDVFYQDAWWEAVLLSDVTSLDDGALVDVMYPDEGDLARVHAKNLRISQFWDEATGEWSVKGSTDLTRFLRRRGIARKEVTSMVDSECRVNGQISSELSEMAVCEKEPIEMCLSTELRHEGSTKAPLPANEVHEEPLLLHSHPNVVPDSPGIDKDINQNLLLTSARNSDMIVGSSASKVSLDTLMSPGVSGNVIDEEKQSPINVDSMLCCNDKNGNGFEEEPVERTEDAGECLPSPLAKEEFIYDNLRSKRRRIEDAWAISCEREAMHSCSHPTASSSSQNHCPPQNHHLETFKPSCEETGSGVEQSLDRGSALYLGIGCNRGWPNFEGSSRHNSGKLFQENDMQQSFGLEESGRLRKKVLKPFSRGILNAEKTYEKKNKPLNTRPVYRRHLLALEAPVRKSQEEYDRITSAGKAALENGTHERVARPTRQKGKKVPSQQSQEQKDQITLVRKPVSQGVVHERVVRPGRQLVKVVPSKKSREEGDQITSTRLATSKEGVHERAVRSRRLVVKERPIQKSQEKYNQFSLAGKAAQEESVVQRARPGRPARAEMLIHGSREEYDQTSSSGKAPLEGDVHERVVRRGRRPGVKALAWRAGEERDQIFSGKPTPEVGVHKRVAGFGGQAADVSRSVDKFGNRERKDTLKSFKERLMRQKQIDSLKRKASGMSSRAEMGGKNAKMLKLSGPQKDSGQAETAEVSLLSNCDNKSLKWLAREIGKRAVLEAGFTIQYKLRRGKFSHDAIYTSPKGSSYWSLPKAWQALGKKGRKGQLRVEKAVAQQVLSKINSDEEMRSAFESLDRFSGTCLREVMEKASFTYEELTDILLDDLHVLRKMMPSKEERLQKGRKSKIINIHSNLKNDTSSRSSESLIFKKRGRKPKQDVQMRLQEVNGRALTSKVSFNSEGLKGGHVSKVEKNRSMLKEVKQRTWLKGVKKAPINKSSSLIKALTEKRRNKLRGSAKSNGFEAKQESQKTKEKAEKPRSGFRLEVRPSISSTDDESEDLSCRSRRTVASWMIDRGAVLEKERIFYVDQMSNETLKEGVLTREGILCRCCKKVYTIQSFEQHGGSQERATYCNLIFTSGRSFLDCQLEAWNVEVQIRKTRNYKGVTANDTNDDTCLLCGDGGSLLCCDLCPSTFHASCLQLDNVPEGNWYCPKCRCGVCRDRNGGEEEGSMAICKQCEHRYHIACLCGGHIIVESDFFCGNLCRKIYSRLCKLVGITHNLDKGFSWTLLRCIEEGDGLVSKDIKFGMKNNSKLAVALLVLKECFNPMDDPRTNIDMITHALYNRGSQFDRLNYVGFYTAILEKDDEIICVASIRIHGARIAEMPLIGTRHKYRRQGMCRLLVGVIEKLLCSLEVGTFILPAIPELFETWTKAFGFRPLDSMQRSDIKDLSMMVFPGTDLLQKPMPKSSTGSTAMQQICDSPAELPRVTRAHSLDDCQNLRSAGSGRMADIEMDSLAQISDSELLQNDDGDDDVFFDACLNLHSTEASMMVEAGTGSLLNLSSESPAPSPTPCGSPSAKTYSMGTKAKQKRTSGFQQTHLASSGESDSVNAEVCLDKTRDHGTQDAEGSLLATSNAELQKMEQGLDYKQVDKVCNGSWNGEVTLQDACAGGSSQPESSFHSEQTSWQGSGIGLRDRQLLKMNSDSATLKSGNSQASERLERGCGSPSSKPSSECMPLVSSVAIAPFCKARDNGFLRPEQGTKVMGTDPPMPVFIEETGAMKQILEAGPDSAMLGCGVSGINKGNIFIITNDSDQEKQKLVPDPVQMEPTSPREVGSPSIKGSFLELRDVDTQKLEPISEANGTDPTPCGGSSVEGSSTEEGIVACKS